MVKIADKTNDSFFYTLLKEDKKAVYFFV